MTIRVFLILVFAHGPTLVGRYQPKGSSGLNVCIPLDLHALNWIDAPVCTLQGGLRVMPGQWLVWTVSQ